MTETDWAAVFHDVFATRVSPVDARIGREVYGDEYPEEVEPHSYVTRTDLHDLAAAVAVAPGQTLVDIGCGRGGPGLWVAATTGADLIGVDISDTALEAARERAVQLGLRSRVEYRLGTFEDLPIPDASVDGVMSVDALIFSPNKSAALRELARVLVPGGRLAFTTWDYHRQPEGRPPQVDDHRPLLEAAGFDVIAYRETADWRPRMVRADELLLDAVDELAAETGVPVEQLRADLVTMCATVDAMTRRVLAVATRR